MEALLNELPCQAGDSVRSSRYYPRHFTIFYRIRSNLKQHGFLATTRKVWSQFVTGTLAIGPQAVQQAKEDEDAGEVLDLQPGEMVEVKSEEDIRRTLDATGKNRGLGFMPEMWEYCGQRARVFRRVEKICVESAHRTVRTIKHTVILEGAICKGGGIDCDRSCFYFWRECWLKRVPSSSTSPGVGSK